MTSIPSFWKRLNDPRFDAPPPILSSAYLPSLDGLRALSIAFVIAGHSVLGTPYEKFYSGATGVNIFFVISGFLITTLLLKEKVRNGKVSLKRFYLRRFLRIFPVAYLYLVVLLFLNRAFQLHIGRTDFITAFLYIKNLTIIHPAVTWQVVHYWSLSVEEQFYLLFPFLLLYHYKMYMRLIPILFVAVPTAIIFNYHGGRHLTGVPHILLQTLVDVGTGMMPIFFGSLGAILLFKGMIPVAFLDRCKRLAPVLLVLIAMGHMEALGIIPGWQSAWLYLTPPMICFTLLLSLRPGTWFFSLLNTRAFKQIGVLSYSLYIWQELFTSQQPWGGSLWWNLPALFLVAWLSYHFYEKAFLKLKDRFKDTSPTRANTGHFPMAAT